MIRPAARADIPRLLEIRDDAGGSHLSDPRAVTEEGAAGLIDRQALWVWEEADGLVSGFAASEARDGSIWALLVAPGYEGKGIGRALLAQACTALRNSGHRKATIRTKAGTDGERHLRAAGWRVGATNATGVLHAAVRTRKNSGPRRIANEYKLTLHRPLSD